MSKTSMSLIDCSGNQLTNQSSQTVLFSTPDLKLIPLAVGTKLIYLAVFISKKEKKKLNRNKNLSCTCRRLRRREHATAPRCRWEHATAPVQPRSTHHHASPRPGRAAGSTPLWPTCARPHALSPPGHATGSSPPARAPPDPATTSARPRARLQLGAHHPHPRRRSWPPRAPARCRGRSRPSALCREIRGETK
ncbi:unnamed protein product [Urochloa humidicola]